MLAAMMTLLVPISMMSFSIDLAAGVPDRVGIILTWLTDSAGSKGFLITLTVLGLLMLRLGMSREQCLAKLIQLALILLIGFASKTGLKVMTESPRPYTEFMAEQLVIPNADHFYKLTQERQNELIEAVSASTSEWRTRHWLGETDYSFPSGHTIFAATCVAFFAGLFLQWGRPSWALGILVWALVVSYSRLWLGMHRPIDLFGSTAFVAAVYAILPSFSHSASRLSRLLPENGVFRLLGHKS